MAFVLSYGNGKWGNGRGWLSAIFELMAADGERVTGDGLSRSLRGIFIIARFARRPPFGGIKHDLPGSDTD